MGRGVGAQILLLALITTILVRFTAFAIIAFDVGLLCEAALRR